MRTLKLLVVLVVSLAVAKASAQESARTPNQPRVVTVNGLGDMLVVGTDAASALARYSEELIRRGVFAGQSAQIRTFAAMKARSSNIATLRARRRPIVGIQLDNVDSFLTKAGKWRSTAYAHAVREAGGIPVFLPPADSARHIGAYLGAIDHLIVAGGEDVHPTLYRAQMKGAQATNITRDRYVSTLISEAIAVGLGVDGICKGMQILNVALGGSLIQDLPTKGILGHDDMLHYVRVKTRSKTAQAVGSSRLPAQSIHHQAIDRVAHRLRVVGRSDDGVVEAVEGFGGRVRGYQFHPERSPAPVRQAIFRDLVARAARRVSGR